MSWTAMLDAAETQLRADHGLTEAAHETAAWTARSANWGVSFKQGYRTAWWDAIKWVLQQQEQWDSLTETDAILELRKGTGSIYWPLFSADPRIFADCPNCGRVSVGAQGYCDQCTYEWM